MAVPDSQSLMLPSLQALSGGAEMPIGEVRRLVAAMGQVTGRSGDGGTDGTIREDALGLDEVYVQAKKYAEGNTVGESDLRNFAGAIDAAGTNKGVFVTTASFTPAARRYVRRSPKRIVLIDGGELARRMVKHNVGVRPRIPRVFYEIKRIDEDYFSQE